MEEQRIESREYVPVYSYQLTTVELSTYEEIQWAQLTGVRGRQVDINKME